MRLKNTQTILFLAAILVFCSSVSSNQQKDIDKKATDFRQLVKSFKVLPLPARIKPISMPTKEFSQTYQNSIDTEFIGTNAGHWICYGLLPDTTIYFHLIWLVPTELYVPIITTFTKSGKMISEHPLTLGNCASGPCGYDCSETAIINKDYTFYIADTISIGECDSLGNIIQGTTRYQIDYITGNRAANGKLEFTKAKEKKLFNIY